MPIDYSNYPLNWKTEMILVEVTNLPEWVTKEKPAEGQVDSPGHYYGPRAGIGSGDFNRNGRVWPGGFKRWSLTATVG